eukprot:2461597-Ditylum_brightwellii.AAC.1
MTDLSLLFLPTSPQHRIKKQPRPPSITFLMPGPSQASIPTKCTAASKCGFTLTLTVNLIFAVNISTQKMAHHYPLSVSSHSVGSYELYKQNMDDCKKLPGSLFESTKQLHI